MRRITLKVSTVALLALTTAPFRVVASVDLADVDRESGWISPQGIQYCKSKSDESVRYRFDACQKAYYKVSDIDVAMLSPQMRAQLESDLESLEQVVSVQSHRTRDLETLLEKESAKVSRQLSIMAAESDLLDIAQDKTCLLNQLTAEDAKMYGHLSSAVYDELYSKKAVGRRSAMSNKLERKIADLEKEYEQLLGAKGKTQELLSASFALEKDEKELARREKVIVSLLKKMGVKLSRKTGDLDSKGHIKSLSGVVDKIEHVVDRIQNDIRIKRQVLEGQNPEHFEAVRKALNLSAYGSQFEPVHILYRNSGELSGVVLFDKDNHQLTFVMAGSKSSTDWVRNFMGWNSKSRALHGNLTGLHVHAGFLSHFEAVQDSYNAFLRPFLEDWKKLNPGKKLSITGTGHSLGGALAELFTLSAIETAKRLDIDLDKKGTMTFGAPNVFNAKDIDHVVAQMGGKGNFLRIQDRFDPVPHACFWRESPGVVIRASAGFFEDEAGVMQLPGRFNPHSSGDYAHFADKVFGRYKTSLANLTDMMTAQSDVHKSLLAAKESHQSAVKDLRTAVNDLANDTHRQEYRSQKIKALTTLVKGDLAREVALAVLKLKSAKSTDIMAAKAEFESAKQRREYAKREMAALQAEESDFQKALEEHRLALEEDRQKLLDGSMLGSICLDQSFPGQDNTMGLTESFVMIPKSLEPQQDKQNPQGWSFWPFWGSGPALTDKVGATAA